MARRAPPDRFQDMIEAATRVFIAQGYRRTQMVDVADAMGVAKGTLYLYVESKEALFDAAVRHADQPRPIPAPAALPLRTPRPEDTLAEVERRLVEGGALPALAAALARSRVVDVRAELEAVLRELYGALARHRNGIKLLDRCALDYPELAKLWYGAGREGALALLTRYLEERARRGRVRRFEDAAVAARVVLETLIFWAVHRHWDPHPQVVDDATAERTAIEFVLGALVKE
ncbi:MAG: TetR family transcriptional regulator [Proteobacteria bacterium]|nr:MAG: TetR family transcriptional regulator [Pseudomonadota bacterium]